MADSSNEVFGGLVFTATGYPSQVHIERSSESAPAVSLLFSTDDGATWNDFIVGETFVQLSANGHVWIKAGPGGNGAFSNGSSENHFVIDGVVAASGNINSLISADYDVVTELPDYCFAHLFASAYISSAPDLPADAVGRFAYTGMFLNCYYLRTPPVISAKRLSQGCFQEMFRGSTLEVPPVLPAENLAPSCYQDMFRECASLTSTPDLPAKTLPPSCYMNMFEDCHALKYLGSFSAESAGQGSCDSMFFRCDSLTDASSWTMPSTTDIECFRAMFGSCTSLVTGPSLPATELSLRCYEGMFSDCPSLSRAPVIPARVLADGCYRYMFSGCSSLSYIETGMLSWGNSSTMDWVSGVASSGTFVCRERLPVEYGDSHIPMPSSAASAGEATVQAGGWTVSKTRCASELGYEPGPCAKEDPDSDECRYIWSDEKCPDAGCGFKDETYFEINCGPCEADEQFKCGKVTGGETEPCQYDCADCDPGCGTVTGGGNNPCLVSCDMPDCTGPCGETPTGGGVNPCAVSTADYDAKCTATGGAVVTPGVCECPAGKEWRDCYDGCVCDPDQPHEDYCACYYPSKSGLEYCTCMYLSAPYVDYDKYCACTYGEDTQEYCDCRRILDPEYDYCGCMHELDPATYRTECKRDGRLTSECSCDCSTAVPCDNDAEFDSECGCDCSTASVGPDFCKNGAGWDTTGCKCDCSTASVHEDDCVHGFWSEGECACVCNDEDKVAACIESGGTWLRDICRCYCGDRCTDSDGYCRCCDPCPDHMKHIGYTCDCECDVPVGSECTVAEGDCTGHSGTIQSDCSCAIVCPGDAHPGDDCVSAAALTSNGSKLNCDCECESTCTPGDPCTASHGVPGHYSEDCVCLPDCTPGASCPDGIHVYDQSCDCVCENTGACTVDVGDCRDVPGQVNETTCACDPDCTPGSDCSYSSSSASGSGEVGCDCVCSCKDGGDCVDIESHRTGAWNEDCTCETCDFGWEAKRDACRDSAGTWMQDECSCECDTWFEKHWDEARGTCVCDIEAECLATRGTCNNYCECDCGENRKWYSDDHVCDCSIGRTGSECREPYSGVKGHVDGDTCLCIPDCVVGQACKFEKDGCIGGKALDGWYDTDCSCQLADDPEEDCAKRPDHAFDWSACECKCNDETGRSDCEGSFGFWDLVKKPCACDCGDPMVRELVGTKCQCKDPGLKSACSELIAAGLKYHWDEQHCSCCNIDERSADIAACYAAGGSWDPNAGKCGGCKCPKDGDEFLPVYDPVTKQQTGKKTCKCKEAIGLEPVCWARGNVWNDAGCYCKCLTAGNVSAQLCECQDVSNPNCIAGRYIQNPKNPNDCICQCPKNTHQSVYSCVCDITEKACREKGGTYNAKECTCDCDKATVSGCRASEGTPIPYPNCGCDCSTAGEGMTWDKESKRCICDKTKKPDNGECRLKNGGTGHYKDCVCKCDTPDKTPCKKNGLDGEMDNCVCNCIPDKPCKKNNHDGTVTSDCRCQCPGTETCEMGTGGGIVGTDCVCRCSHPENSACTLQSANDGKWGKDCNCHCISEGQGCAYVKGVPNSGKIGPDCVCHCMDYDKPCDLYKDGTKFGTKDNKCNCACDKEKHPDGERCVDSRGMYGVLKDCKCGCDVKQSEIDACNNNPKKRWNAKGCNCICRDDSEEGMVPCEKGKKRNPDTCECDDCEYTKDNNPCTDKQVFVEAKCACECDESLLGKCANANEKHLPPNCECGCDKEDSACGPNKTLKDCECVCRDDLGECPDDNPYRDPDTCKCGPCPAEVAEACTARGSMYTLDSKCNCVCSPDVPDCKYTDPNGVEHTVKPDPENGCTCTCADPGTGGGYAVEWLEWPVCKYRCSVEDARDVCGIWPGSPDNGDWTFDSNCRCQCLHDSSSCEQGPQAWDAGHCKCDNCNPDKCKGTNRPDLNTKTCECECNEAALTARCQAKNRGVKSLETCDCTDDCTQEAKDADHTSCQEFDTERCEWRDDPLKVLNWKERLQKVKYEFAKKKAEYTSAADNIVLFNTQQVTPCAAIFEVTDFTPEVIQTYYDTVNRAKDSVKKYQDELAECVKTLETCSANLDSLVDECDSDIPTCECENKPTPPELGPQYDRAVRRLTLLYQDMWMCV